MLQHLPSNGVTLLKKTICSVLLFRDTQSRHNSKIINYQRYPGLWTSHYKFCIHQHKMAAFELTNKVILVTGGASGIGAGVIRLLCQEKVKHVAILDLNEHAGLSFQNELNAEYGSEKVKFYKCDVTNDEQFFGAFESIVNQYGYIDVVINSAGIIDETKTGFKKTIEVNLTALVNSTWTALDLMRKDKNGRGGTIINFSSICALSSGITLPIYAATKSAVLHLSNCLGAKDFNDITGVRVLAICFGITITGIEHTVKDFHDHGQDKILRAYPKQRVESAAQAVIAAYKAGSSDSTWVSSRDMPAVDITEDVRNCHKILFQHA